MRLALLLFVVACSDELHEDQGPCTQLDMPHCEADARCQQAVVVGGLIPANDPLECLLVDTAGPSSTDACASLDHDHCRARADCSPVYFQETGPTDAPVGEPTYQSCEVEP